MRNLIIQFILIFWSLSLMARPLVRVTDDSGKSFSFKEYPKRIISLAPTPTDILLELGADDLLIAATRYCDIAHLQKRISIIGGFLDVDIQAVKDLDPDLILAFGTMQIPLMKKLRAAGLPVFYIYPRNVDDILTCIDRYGKITGRQRSAEAAIISLKNSFKQVQQQLDKNPHKKKKRVFRVMDIDPPGTIGAQSYQSDVFRYAGAENIYADVEEDYFTLDFEMLRERNPDVIIVCETDSSHVADRIRAHAQWQTIPAVQRGDIITLPCNIICRPGPQVGESIRMLAAKLYPNFVKAVPERIVSLAPSLTGNIYALGMEDFLVGNTIYCNQPPAAKLKPKVATAIDVNMERLLSLKPDYIITTTLTDFKAVRKTQQLGIETGIFQQPQNFTRMAAQFIKLGRRLGRENKARAIINKALTELAEIQLSLQNTDRPKVFVQLGAKPLYAATSRSFLHDFINRAHAVNMAANAKNGIYSRERVIAENPDIILIVTMGTTGEAEKKIWLKYKSLKAAQTGRVYIIDSDRYCSTSPVLFTTALKDLIPLIHPEISKRN